MKAITFENRFRVLGIDPGTNHTGFAIVDIDLLTGDIQVPLVITYSRKDILRTIPWLVTTYGAREVVVEEYGVVMAHLLRTWEPTAVTSESPYMGRFPATFRALSELLLIFRQAVMRWDYSIPFNTIDPSSVKVFMGVKGTSGDKDKMRKALQSIDYNIDYNGVSLDTVDEHGIDAISVALSTCITTVRALTQANNM